VTHGSGLPLLRRRALSRRAVVSLYMGAPVVASPRLVPRRSASNGSLRCAGRGLESRPACQLARALEEQLRASRAV
jgi:hypothetical protein